MTDPPTLLARRFDGALGALLLIDLGGSIPFGLADTAHGADTADVFDLLASVMLAVAAVGLALAWWYGWRVAVVEWIIRTAAATWLVYAVVVAGHDALDGRTRLALALVIAGIGAAHLVVASRMDRARLR